METVHANFRGIFHLYPAYLRARGTNAQLALEILKLAGSCDGQHLYPAVVQVTRPTLDTQFPSRSLGEVPVPYSLDLP